MNACHAIASPIAAHPDDVATIVSMVLDGDLPLALVAKMAADESLAAVGALRWFAQHGNADADVYLMALVRERAQEEEV